MNAPRTATVIVARSAKDQQARAAERWLNEIVRLASESPGFVRSEVQPPGPDHPNEWVVVYEFRTRDELDAWLSSSVRSEMVAREPDIFLGHPREQVLAARNLEHSVTAVASFRLASLEPDSPRGVLDAQTVEAAFVAEYDRLHSVVSRFPGFLRCEYHPATQGVQDEEIIVFTFADRPSLDGWLGSEERKTTLERIRPLLKDDRTLNIVGGFAGWFDTQSDRPVKTWKSAALILLALYPTALAVGYVRDLALPDLSGPVATLIGNAGGVAILSWFVMPPLTRRLALWLRS